MQREFPSAPMVSIGAVIVESGRVLLVRRGNEPMKMLKGMTTSELDQVFSKVELTPGAEDLIRVLKKLGYKVALISGGFSYVAERLKNRLGIISFTPITSK